MRFVKLLLSASMMVSSAYAEDLKLGGHLKYQGSVLDNRDSSDISALHFLDGRVKASDTIDIFSLDAQGEMLGVGSDRAITELFPRGQAHLLPNDKIRALRMTSLMSEDSQSQSEIRIDRLALSLKKDDFTFSLGRQALSLGNGIAFHVLDVFSPFSPTAVDKEYKTGDDMLRSSYSFGEFGDSEFIFIPRRSPVDYDFEEDQNTYLFQHRIRIDQLESDLNLITARHFGRSFLGGGASKDVLGATIRSDLSVTSIDGGRSAVSGLINIDRGFEILEKNVYGYLEFYHSGFGSTNEGYFVPNETRDERLVRGEIYTLGKNYSSFGGRVEITPLVNMFSGIILNLQDRSTVLQSRVAYDASQDLVIQIGFIIPLGSRGTEYGLPVGPASNENASFNEFYTRLEYYL